LAADPRRPRRQASSPVLRLRASAALSASLISTPLTTRERGEGVRASGRDTSPMQPEQPSEAPERRRLLVVQLSSEATAGMTPRLRRLRQRSVRAGRSPARASTHSCACPGRRWMLTARERRAWSHRAAARFGGHRCVLDMEEWQSGMPARGNQAAFDAVVRGLDASGLVGQGEARARSFSARRGRGTCEASRHLITLISGWVASSV
jgi:hypothetical protein